MVMPHVGKIFICLLFCVIVSVHGKVTLSVRGMRGERLEKVGMGVPFNLEVTIDGTQKDFTMPEIQSPIGRLQRTGLRMETFNGVSRTTYIYSARIDKPGQYTFGPAVVTSGAGIEQSETVEVDVAEQTVAQSQRRRQQQDEAAIARLSLSSDKAVVGEKIYATLRFYRLQPTVEFLALAEPEDKKDQGYTIKNKREALVGREEIEGTSADYIEWSWELYPTKTGEIIIPAYRVDYTVLPDRYDFFSTLFGARIAKTIYSNAVTLKIDPLPAYQGHVDGIGHVKNIHISLQPAVMREGEGATLTIAVDGDIDMEQFPLHNIPDSIKVYESKKYMQDKKQCFEYVIQAIKSGEFEIPSQQITYFDVELYRYRKAITPVTPFTILKSDKQQVVFSDDEQVEREAKKAENRHEIKGLIRHFYGAYGRNVHIPWWLFIILCLLPILFAIKNAKTSLFGVLGSWFPGIQRRMMFSSIRWQLGKSRQVPYDWHFIFLSMFASLLNKHISQVTGEDIERWMTQRTTDQELWKWQQFFNNLHQANYFSDKAVDIDQLYKQAMRWIYFISEKA
ncbi:MAG: BatD family protein [Candidatus Dependentiae bacterium]|nr:BatD family protein [Candidatus Dependentiae bacterium]